MKRILICLGAALALSLSQSSIAALRVLACEPEWGALVQELAGDKASVYVATTALQDPHRIQARPSLIASARNADLLVCTGAELEMGWLPILLRQSSNAAIQPGKPGYFEAAEFVRKLEVPARLVEPIRLTLEVAEVREQQRRVGPLHLTPPIRDLERA